MSTLLEVTTIRSSSLGIKGTIRNAKHHAKNLIPMIQTLVMDLYGWGFKQWKQAHNVHIFTSHDGRQFAFKPVRDPKTNEYVGLRLFYRESRSRAYPIATVFYDGRNGVTVEQLSAFMPAISDPILEADESNSSSEEQSDSGSKNQITLKSVLNDASKNLNRIEYAIFTYLIKVAQNEDNSTITYRGVGEALNIPYEHDALGKHLGPISNYTWEKYGFMLSVLVRLAEPNNTYGIGLGFLTLADALYKSKGKNMPNDVVQIESQKTWLWALSLI